MEKKKNIKGLFGENSQPVLNNYLTITLQEGKQFPSFFYKKILQVFVVFFLLSRLRDSDPRPSPYHGDALPAELRRPIYLCLTPLIINDLTKLVNSLFFKFIFNFGKVFNSLNYFS